MRLRVATARSRCYGPVFAFDPLVVRSPPSLHVRISPGVISEMTAIVVLEYVCRWAAAEQSS
jgi:hypothetical protein